MNMQIAQPAGRPPGPSPVPLANDEPILQLTAAYWAGIEAFNNLPDDVINDDEARAKAASETYDRHYVELRENPPQIHTVKEAVAALRFVADEMEYNGDVDAIERLVQRTLEFLEGADFSSICCVGGK